MQLEKIVLSPLKELAKLLLPDLNLAAAGDLFQADWPKFSPARLRMKADALLLLL